MTDPYAQYPSPQYGPGAVTPQQWKASDADRQQVADRLARAVDEGRLDLNEYDQRLRASERAQTLSELDQVVADLPVPAEPVLTQIGELTVTASTVHTPMGPIPLRGSQWSVQDQWLTEQKIPTWAIVMSIVGFFCLTVFSLLFLLAKETIFRGHVQVSVSNGGRHYVAYIPVHSHAQVHHLHQQVNYVRSLSVR